LAMGALTYVGDRSYSWTETVFTNMVNAFDLDFNPETLYLSTYFLARWSGFTLRCVAW